MSMRQGTAGRPASLSVCPSWFETRLVEFVMKVLVCAAFGLLCLTEALAASPQRLDMEAVNGSNLPVKVEDGVSPVLIKAQVLLDRARFSPGAIDGRDGENMQNAIKAFEGTRGLKVD